jgi:hypothetical protein
MIDLEGCSEPTGELSSSRPAPIRILGGCEVHVEAAGRLAARGFDLTVAVEQRDPGTSGGIGGERADGALVATTIIVSVADEVAGGP